MFRSLKLPTFSLYRLHTTTMLKASGNNTTTMHCTLTERNMKSLQYIEDVTSNPDYIQQQTLSEILTQNANVEYLNRHGLSGHTDRETFKKLIPVVTYEDLENDITRIANGDKFSILCSHPVSELLTSSGTSGGQSKLFPTTDDELERRCLFFSLLMPVINQFITGSDKGKGMYFLFIRNGTITPGGLVARTFTTSYYNNSRFKESRTNNPYANYTSPNEAILCHDSHQSMYAQMLCGLYFNTQVLRVGTNFAFGLIQAIRFLGKHWSLLSHDIHTGTLNPVITDPSVRDSVTKILKPNQNLADFIEFECSRKSWQGIIQRLWPNTKYVECVITGSMAQYIPTLDYYSNGLPLVSTIYASSECYLCVNLNPLCNPCEVAYMLIPTMGYFEFLPVHRNDHGSTEKQLVDLADVRLDQEYELVVTTYAGLYRYQLGDVLRVVGFKNKAPQFRFMCKKNVVLSIDADKTDEVELQKAVDNAVNHLVPFNVTLTEYTSYTDTNTIPGHYVIFWEINSLELAQVPTSVFEACCLTMEESLNTYYRYGRVSDKSIGPLEIKIVKNGTFDELMDYMVRLGGSVSQYKTPRCVKYEPIVNLLNERVVSSYFSPSCPKYFPGQL